MLRIILISVPVGPMRLKLAGHIGAEEVDLLERELRRWLPEKEELVLDLEGIQFIDEAGLVLLKRWTASGVVLQGGSLFVRTLLKDHGLSDR